MREEYETTRRRKGTRTREEGKKGRSGYENEGKTYRYKMREKSQGSNSEGRKR